VEEMKEHIEHGDEGREEHDARCPHGCVQEHGGEGLRLWGEVATLGFVCSFTYWT